MASAAALSGGVDAAKALFAQFKAEVEKGPPATQAASDMLGRLKIMMTTFSCLPLGTNTNSPQAAKELLLAREINEMGVYLSVQKEDMDAFERHIAQLKIFYSDFSSMMPPSERMLPILGLNLLRLLSQNRIADFHTELELIPLESRSRVYIKHPVQLEEYLMEGNYNKVMNAQKDSPAKESEYFLNILAQTVRRERADCIQVAYKQLSVEDAKQLLMFSTDAEVEDFAAEHDWVIEMGQIVFQEEAKAADKGDIEAQRLISESLMYAKELERIV